MDWYFLRPEKNVPLDWNNCNSETKYFIKDALFNFLFSGYK